MAENMSLADQAVQALSMVKDMAADLTMEDEARHTIRSMKALADQILAAAFRQAIDLAWLAKDLREKSAGKQGKDLT